LESESLRTDVVVVVDMPIIQPRRCVARRSRSRWWGAVNVDLDYMKLLSLLRLEYNLDRSVPGWIVLQAITDLSQKVIDIERTRLLRHDEKCSGDVEIRCKTC
jgi:hypothetical protein